VRSYVLNNYTAVKQANPDFPFIVREAIGAQACVMARYDFGVERRVYLQNASEAEVAETVSQLVEDGKKVNSAVGSRL
jgi:NADH dehydrogenase (ubiquinone) 1 alpha subcomplex subunit 2